MPGYELVEVEEAAGEREYVVSKTAEVREQPGWAIVISDPGLEELLSPLGFALAAAFAGGSVSIYFQGPAVRVLARSFSGKLPGWKRRSARLLAAGLAGRVTFRRMRSSGSSRTWTRGSISAVRRWTTSKSKPTNSSSPTSGSRPIQPSLKG
jgi:hypothetical protein